MNKNNNIILSEYGKLPPQAVDFEEAILGLLMLESDSFLDVSNILKPEMFYKDSHQKIYQSIIDLSENYSPVDILTVTENLQNKALLDECGGVYYISNLTTKVSSAVNIEYYALIVAQKYISRSIITVSNEIMTKCYDDSIDVNDIMDYSYTSFDKINDISLNGSVKSFKENVKTSMDEYEKRVVARKAGLQIAYTTGLGSMNKIFIGWVKTEMTMVAARPSIGKTALALFFAKACAKMLVDVDIFSLEMSSTQLTDRILLGETTINPYNYQSGKDVNWEELEKAAARISNLPIHINDEMDITISYIKSVIRKKFKKGTLGLVIIDYLQLMEGTDKSTKNNEIGTITRELKKLAMKYNFPIILLSQLSRDIEKRGNGRHKLSDLRDSGNIEQDADNVIFVSRDRYDNEGNEIDYSIEENRKVFIDIAKKRNGSLGVITVYCNEYVNNFYEISDIPENYHSITENRNFNNDPPW